MSNKICIKCKKEKNISEFHYKVKTKNKTTYHSYCKICLSKFHMQRWIDRKIKAVEYKGGKCIECNYNKNYAALEFHHRNPLEKDYVWNDLKLRKWASILLELDKCDLLCSNCHAEKHYPHQSIKNK